MLTSLRLVYLKRLTKTKATWEVKNASQQHEFGIVFGDALPTHRFTGYHSLLLTENQPEVIILWIIFLIVFLTAVLILMLLSLGAITSRVTSRFIAGGTYLTSNYHFPKQINFPAITLCNINPFRASAVLSNNLSLEQTDLFLAYLSNTVGVRSLPVSFFASFTWQYDVARGGNSTLFQEMGHTVKIC